MDGRALIRPFLHIASAFKVFLSILLVVHVALELQQRLYCILCRPIRSHASRSWKTFTPDFRCERLLQTDADSGYEAGRIDGVVHSMRVMYEIVCALLEVSIERHDEYDSLWAAPARFSLPTLAVSAGRVDNAYHPFPSLLHMSINSTSLSVTSFHFNHNPKHSEWVERTMGPSAIFYEKRGNQFKHKDFSAAVKTRMILFNNPIVRNFTIDGPHLLAPCSVEILAFVYVDAMHCPFCDQWRHKMPAMGSGKLSIPALQIEWPCYYRAHYENWRRSAEYFPVGIYCPTPKHEDGCMRFETGLRTHRQSPIARLVLDLSTVAWQASRGRQTDTYEVEFRIQNEKHTKLRQKNTKAVVCVPVPYTDKNSDKFVGNAAMMRQFIRYYNKLGFLVMLFDGSGAYLEAMMRDRERERAVVGEGGSREGERMDLLYHGYTIGTLLNPRLKGALVDPYDGTDSYYTADNDKVLTLTQCRVEARHALGAETALVLDFDEFLYCPDARGSLSLLRSLLHQHIERWQREGAESVTFNQMWVANSTERTEECVVKAARNFSEEGASLFKCFRPFDQMLTIHSTKSLYLGNHCLHTTFHDSCSDGQQNQNCACTCVHNRECRAIHLQIRDEGSYRKHAWEDAPGDQQYVEMYGMLRQRSGQTVESLGRDGIPSEGGSDWEVIEWRAEEEARYCNGSLAAPGVCFLSREQVLLK